MVRRDNKIYKIKGYNFGMGGYESYKKPLRGSGDSRRSIFVGVGRKKNVKSNNFELLRAYTTDLKKLRKKDRKDFKRILKIRRKWSKYGIDRF